MDKEISESASIDDNIMQQVTISRILAEKIPIKGYVTVKVIRKDGTHELIQEKVPNLLTTAGLDHFIAQVYTNISAGTRGANFIGLSANTNTPFVGDTELIGEFTSDGLTRVQADTITPINGTNMLTIANTFVATAAITGIAKAALFNALTNGIMVHVGLFANGAINLNQGDQILVTWDITLG